MSRSRFTFGVESLEPRMLMAVLAATPAEISAEYAPPAPPDMSELAHAATIARDTTMPATAAAPHAISLRVESTATANVLTVRFIGLEQPQLVGLVGGNAAWTDSVGAVHFELPHAVQHVELTLANERFLRLALDAHGEIENYVRLTTPGAPADREGTTIIVEGRADNNMQGSMGIAMLTPTGASQAHHGTTEMVAVATISLSTPESGDHPGSDHATSEPAAHSSGADLAMTAGMMPTAPGTISARPNGNDRSMPSTTLAVASQENEATATLSAAATNVESSSYDHETIESIFANWAGGEESAQQETSAMFIADSKPQVLLTSTAQPQRLPSSHADHAEALDAAELVEEFDPELDKDVEDISVWRAGVAIAFSAGCAAGAYALERQAGRIEPTRGRPARMRRRFTSVPAAGSLAKAGM